MPYNSPMKKKGSSCVQMKDPKGKPSGLMMEGSVAYQEKTKKVEEAKAKKLDKKQEIKETKDLLTEMPVDDKASAMEMSPYKMDHEGSPNKMSPLNDNHGKIDPKTGKRVVQPFVDPGAPEGFVNDARPYDFTNERGVRLQGEYDPEEASRVFTGAQSQVQNALDLAKRQLGGEEVFNKMLKGGYGSRSLTGPQAAQVITGYSAGEEGEETVGGGGKVRFNIGAVQNKLDELNKLAITDPVSARSYVSKRISGAPLGDDSNKFMRDINPLKRN